MKIASGFKFKFGLIHCLLKQENLMDMGKNAISTACNVNLIALC